jgi:hypothetical protein
MPSSDPEAPPGETPNQNPVAQYAREHPIAATTLGLAVIAGSTAGYSVFAESLSPVRGVLGGALAGFGCWFLVMIGRVIGD